MILWNGNEIGDFQSSDRTDIVLLPLLYMRSLIAIFIPIRRRIKGQNLKYRIFTIICVAMIAGLPTFVVSGAIKYVDYYTTNKTWKVLKGVITGKHVTPGRRSHSIYTYSIKTVDTIYRFSSVFRYSLGQELHLKICNTNLGITVAKID
jgi:hypothetical protein